MLKMVETMTTLIAYKYIDATDNFLGLAEEITITEGDYVDLCRWRLEDCDSCYYH